MKHSDLYVGSWPCCRCWRQSSLSAAKPDRRRRRQLRRAGRQDNRAQHGDPERRLSAGWRHGRQHQSCRMPFCRAIGVATPTADSHIGFEVWLPPASSWNGKFPRRRFGRQRRRDLAGPMREALLGGYATMSTDNGHVDGANGEHGLSWAYKHPEKMVDWAWRALHVSTIAAKKTVAAFYGKPAAKNYFVSCSAGSHHAIMEATRFPSDYDGMVGGAAPWKWTALMFGHTWNSMPAMKDASALTAESVAILNRRMIAACDKLDGLEDGIIADPRRCTVDPGQFQCNDTGKTRMPDAGASGSGAAHLCGREEIRRHGVDAGPGARQRGWAGLPRAAAPRRAAAAGTSGARRCSRTRISRM